MSSKLFFSSCFEDPEGERLAIRDRVMALNPRVDRSDAAAVAALPVWLAENHSQLDPGAPTPPLDKALFCVDGVRESNIYVAVVRSRHGSGVALSPAEQVQASYFELELFEAALLRKPSYIYLLKGAGLSPRIEALLRLLAPAFPGLSWTPLDEDAIFARVETLLERQIRPSLLHRMQRAVASGREVADRLTGRRFHSYDPMREPPGIQFLGGMDDRTIAPPDAAKVSSILDRAAAEPNQHVRLTLLWMAIRELMGAPPADPAWRRFLPLWDSTLSAWNSAGAWFGLHGHPLMGCLAALGSLTRIRESASGLIDAPHGAMASEYYSIARQLGRPALKQGVLATSRQHIEAAFLRDASSGNHAVRGSIRRAQGDAAGGIEDYRRVLSLRENEEDASAAAIADARSELGFALVFAGERQRGLALMEQGVEALAGEIPSGFLVRAKRKLGRAYLRAGAPRRALRTLAEAHDVAVRYGMHDQIDRIDRLAARIERTLRFG